MFVLADVALVVGLAFGLAYLYKTVASAQTREVIKGLPERCRTCDSKDGLMIREGRVECLLCGDSQ